MTETTAHDPTSIRLPSDRACVSRSDSQRSAISIGRVACRWNQRPRRTLKQACSPASRQAQGAFKNSMTHEACTSHHVSQFAAFFIDARAKRSIAKSRIWVLSCPTSRHPCVKGSTDIHHHCSQAWMKGKKRRAFEGPRPLHRHTAQVLPKGGWGKRGRGWKPELPPKPTPMNDPSAGSPTETLLRLLLPLDDKV